MGNSNSQDSPRLELGGSHHLPPYSIFYDYPRGPHPNGFLSQDSQVGVPKLPRLGSLRLWGPITLLTDLWWRWGLKQSCSLHREISNNMSHTTCTQGNRVYFLLLLLGSQIGNLTPGPSFGHNLCFKYSNEWCKPILDIYVSRAFQWYNFSSKPLSFDPYNHPLKIRESTGTLSPKVGVALGVWGFIPSHSFAFLETCNMTLGLLSWLATLKALCLGCESKARVATSYICVVSPI